MSSLLQSSRDLDFLLYEWLDVASLTSRERYREHSRETFDDKFTGAGLVGASMDEQVAWFQAANVGTASYPFLTIGNANLLLAHGSAEQVDTYVRPMVEGRFFGTMCLSEPQAGSSLADVTTRAEPQDDDSYRLFGNKMWISAGDHELSQNIVHLVLARITGAPAGVKGLSLFVVPKYLVSADGSIGERNDVALAGLNHTMGYRGTTNALLNFGEGFASPAGAPGAVGFLVGQPHQGLASMFPMMNEARIGVGLGAAALGYTGYLRAVDYARSRPQGRSLDDKDPTTEQVPIIEHTDVRRMLLAQKAYVEGALALELYCSRLLDEQLTAATAEDRDRALLLLDVLTPIAKSWPSPWCLEANSLAIQVHGGYGYTRGFAVEQLYRDNRLNPIHEGTHGIQAVGHVVGAWIWAEQVIAAQGKEGTFYAGKRQAARYFFRCELPRTGPQLDLLAQQDRTTLDLEPGWF